MSFRTEIQVPKSDASIRYDSNLLFIGSCFSVEIAQKLSNIKYNVLQNPAGITFNPKSILTTIRACTSGKSLLEKDFFFHNGLWKNSDFHGSYNNPDKSICRQNADKSLSIAHEFINSITHLVITLGSAYVYYDTKSGKPVNNCHKRPSQEFSKRLLTVEEIIQDIGESIDLCRKRSDHSLRSIITVSPVRHIKDGIIENQRSKARLIEATHAIIDKNSDVEYFPAYELLLDDLRDYRFFGKDLVHPSVEAVDYIYDKFDYAYLDTQDAALRNKLNGICRSLTHKSQFPTTEEHQVFMKQLIIKIEAIMDDYPFIDLNYELLDLKSKML